jgi:hypothetical protein
VEYAPAGVISNVVLIDLQTEVSVGNLELYLGLVGPRLPAGGMAAAADTLMPLIPGALIQPAPCLGNQEYQLLGPTWQTRRIGFVLPSAALARHALENLRPLGPLRATPWGEYSFTLFEVRESGGPEYRATVQIAPLLTPNNPRWVAVHGNSTQNESGVSLTWQLRAAQPGVARATCGSSRAVAQLQPEPAGQLFATPITLELSRVETNRVRLVRSMYGVTSTSEFGASFRDVAAELVRTARFSMKTTRGEEIELCEVQGQPLIVRVEGGAAAAPPRRPVRVSIGGWEMLLITLLLLGGAGVVVTKVVLTRAKARPPQ